MKALDLVELTSVEEFVAFKSQRKFYKVTGHKVYHLLGEVSYCKCQEFQRILRSAKGLIVTCKQCKHMLAVRLSQALQKVKSTCISDEEFYLLYSQVN